MRTLFVVTLLLIPLSPSLAQDPGRTAPNASQSAPPQPGSTAATTAQSKSRGQSDRVLERMGPGIDWDHRKAGRDWKIVPGHDRGETGRN
jgi:hypothetical protein